MRNKSIKKDYEFRYVHDFGDVESPEGRRFVKRTSHKRVRSRFNKAARNDAVSAIVEGVFAANRIGTEGESYE